MLENTCSYMILAMHVVPLAYRDRGCIAWRTSFEVSRVLRVQKHY
ncbi:MAG: hypothetical protein QXV30_00905 [Desulfurococcaceae archaeon]